MYPLECTQVSLAVTPFGFIRGYWDTPENASFFAPGDKRTKSSADESINVWWDVRCLSNLPPPTSNSNPPPSTPVEYRVKGKAVLLVITFSRKFISYHQMQPWALLEGSIHLRQQFLPKLASLGNPFKTWNSDKPVKKINSDSIQSIPHLDSDLWPFHLRDRLTIQPNAVLAPLFPAETLTAWVTILYQGR